MSCEPCTALPMPISQATPMRTFCVVKDGVAVKTLPNNVGDYTFPLHIMCRIRDGRDWTDSCVRLKVSV